MFVVNVLMKEDVTKDEIEEKEEEEEEEEDVDDAGDEEEGYVDEERTASGGKRTKKSGRRRRQRAGEAGITAGRTRVAADHPDCTNVTNDRIVYI